VRPDPPGKRAFAQELDIGPQADDLAQAGLVHADGGRRARVQALDGHIARGVVQRRDEPAQHRDRVWHGPAVLTAVHSVIKGPDLDRAVGNAAQGRNESRLPDGPVGAVRDHDGVGLQQMLVGAEEFGQVSRTRFFLTFDKDGDVERRPAGPRLHGRRMHGDAGLVVGGTPPEQAPVAFGRLERGRVPQVRGTRWLDVMMGVEQQPRRSGRSPDRAVHRGMRTVDLQQPGVAEPRA
jgi:hypothetical protein